MTASVPTAQPDGGAGSPPPRRLGRALKRRLTDGSPIRWLGRGGAVIPLLMLLFVLITLIIKAIPALEFAGPKFITGTRWNFGAPYGTPVTTNGLVHNAGESFGALPEILGTLATSAIALIIAIPVSIGAALVIVERLPRRLANYFGLFLELLAGIPSVIIGLWGALTFGPFIAHNVAPIISNNVPDWPGLSFFRGDTGNGQGLLTSGLILAIMVIPIIAATARDLIRGVPILPREGAIALGMSDFECARKVTLPWVGAGLVGAVVLGLGRALGETIAVAMVCGVALGSLPTNLYAAMITIAANLVQNIDTAILDKMDISAFAALALILLVITLLANIGARMLVRKVSGTALPVGRGL
ncbi:MAG TPA: phosphate ABC transporter permease subunit PstC [Streptosporangiaceae bacterium]|nr:phosphate ABC transporter permease subunit PstC [Streptosporangiaceae bacterium]